MTSHSFHDLHPDSALLCCIVVFVPTVGSTASRTNLVLFLRGSLGFIQGLITQCGKGCLMLWWRRKSEVMHCAVMVVSWSRFFGSPVSYTWVSVPASCPSREPTPAALAPLGSEQDVSCPARSR